MDGIAFGSGRSQYLVLYHGDTYVPVGRVLGFAVRGVARLTYEFAESPFDVFAEIAPMLVLSPQGGMGIDAALGVRIYP